MLKKEHLYPLLILVLGAFLVTGCSSAPETNDQHMEDEHEEVEGHPHIGPPHEYEDLSNPFGDNQDTIDAGATIYETNCATCHGPRGEGDGPAAETLDPKPASLADAHMMEDLSDGYLFWRVSEGGTSDPFNSAMPPWKDVLSEEERWQVILFVRSLSEDGP